MLVFVLNSIIVVLGILFWYSQVSRYQFAKLAPIRNLRLSDVSMLGSFSFLSGRFAVWLRWVSGSSLF